MSYMDEYNKLKKKRLEQELKTSAKATNSGGSSYLTEYNRLKGKSNSETVLNNAIWRSTTLAKKDEEKKKEKEAESKKDERKWYQKGHFEDGYDFGDVAKTILGVGNDKDTVSLTPAKKLESLYSVYGKEDFGTKSGYVSTKADGFWDKLGSKYGMGYNDLQYEYINNQNGIRDEIDTKAISFGSDTGKTTSSYKEKALDYMTDDEVAVYNYYYQTEGKEKAQEFLDALAETLSARKAGKDFSNIQGKTGQEILYGVVAGDEQFKQGVKSFGKMIVGEDDYIPQTSTQILSGLIREDLADDGDGINLFGNSLGQFGYDALSAGTNMIPSIAIGAVNPVAGATLMGVSAAGNTYQEDINEGNGKGKSAIHATTVGTLEGMLQYFLGGIGKLGGTSAAINRAVSGIKNGALRFGLEYGGKIASEAFEEGLQEVLAPIVKNAILGTDESIDWEEAAYSALLGGTMGGVFGASEVSQNHLSTNEQAVLDKVYNDTVAEKEKNGKLTTREKNKIYDDVVKQMEQGRIDTDTIESVLGGESYSSYQSMVEQETSLKEEIEALENTPENQFTVKQRERLTELRERLKGIDTKTAKSNLFSEVDKLTANDTKLRESYNERTRRGQAFEADLTKYDAKQQETIKKAINSGILNNTNRTHEFVDLVAKISADKGVPFDFTNNQKLKESGFAIDGKQVNGFVTKDGVTVNVNSSKSLDTVVGHEIAHVLEGTDLYTELQTAIVEYAKSKNDYQGRYDTLTKLYENIEGADIDSELTAELVGDYIFTDTDFINNLSTNHRNVFQKVYDEIKYLYKVATAGSKEARELERVKKLFEQAYRDSKAEITDTKYSFSGVNPNENGYQIADAEKMEADGKTSEEIRQETGWFRSYDNRWRYEIDDSKAVWHLDTAEPDRAHMLRFGEKQYRLEDLLEHDELYRAYPQLKDVTVYVNPNTEFGGYVVGRSTDHIAIGDVSNNSTTKWTLIHELQHIIQNIEGFATGASKYEYSYQEWGEKEYEALEKRKEIAKKLYAILRRNGVSISRDAISYNQSSFNISDDIIEENYFKLQSLGWNNKKTEALVDEYYEQVQILNRTTPEGQYHATAGEIEAYDAQARMNMSAEDRKGMRPSVDRTDAIVKYSVSDPTNRSISQSEAIDNGQNLTYNGIRGEEYVRTDEFRNLQAESQRMSDEDAKLYRSGSKQLDDEVRGRLSRTFGLELRSANSKRISSVRTLLNPKTNKNVNIVEGVDGSLFHDVFEISRKYLRNGELVDLHTVETTEDGIGYNDCYNYLSEDGLSGFSITPDGDLISVFNLNTERGFLKTIAPIVREKAKTLDCYASPNQNLMVMYEKIFGFKTASLMDYNMDYDHDNIAENHSMPRVAFMVNTDSDVELREFTETEYDEALEYRNSFIDQAADSEAASFMPKTEADDIAPVKYSLGYHAGDLGKSESLAQQGLGRDTGHFGTGTYFVGNKDSLNGYNTRNGKAAPVEAVDFAKYNLFKPKNADDGYALHDFLRGVDGYWDREADAVNTIEEYESLQEKLSELVYDIESEEFGETDPNKESWVATEREFVSTAKRMMGDYKIGNELTGTLSRLVDGNFQYDSRNGEYYSYDFDTDKFTQYSEDEIIQKLNAEAGGWKAYEAIEKLADDYYSYSRASRYEAWSASIKDVAKILGVSEQEVRNIIQSVTADINSKGYTDADMETADSAATRFMKALGYEGIDVRGIKALDNTTYGSVIYDLKGEDLARKQEIGTAGYSLSDSNDIAPTGKFLGKDIALETAPVAETTNAEADIAPVAEAKVEDYAPGESLEEQLAKADDALESLDIETEALFRELSEQKITDEEFQTRWKDLDKRFTQARQEQERLSAEMTDINNRKYESLDDSDIPPEAEAPYPGEPNPIAPADPFAERDMKDVGKRNVKAYMHENPEVKPYFQEAAMGMLYDLNNGTKGERLYNDQVYYESGGEQGWMGTTRRTTKDIAELLDQWHYTYDQIEKGLNAIIEDNGKENNAVSKRIEFMLDNRLRNGYTDVDGRPLPKNDEYINLLKEKQIDDYRSHFFDGFMEVADQYAPPVGDIAPVEDIAPLKVEPAIEGEQSVLDEFEQTEQVQQEQTPERLTRAKLHSQIIDKIKSVFTGKGIDFDKVLDDAHRMNAVSINDNTPQRVNDKTFGYEAGEALNDLTFNKVALNESNGIKWLNEQVETIRKLSKKYKIKPLSKESAAAQMYAEGFWVNEKDEIIAYGDAELAKDFPDVQVQKRIKALASDPIIRKIYDDTLSAINESRTRNAYPEIPRLENYYLHFRAMDDTFSRLGIPFNPNDIKAKDLPTDINGTTIDRKPGQPFFTSAMHREGKRTSFDLFGGLEKYLNSAKNQIYHIDDIQTARALWGYIADRYGQAHGLENLDDMAFEAQQEHIQKVYDGHLSNYARFLVEYANNLAGKTALIDRGVEGLIGRRALQFINTVNMQTSRNQVGYSISSPLTNFIPSMEAIARTSKRDSIKAFAQTVSNVFRKDGFVESDPTLIRRRGADKFSKTLWEKMSDPGFILMGAVDNVTSEFIVRTKYNELTRKGMDSKQAHIKAGEWASRVMGDRSLGQMPLLYNSKIMGLFTKYQLEVRNALDSQFYDTFQEAKASTKETENQKAKNALTATKFAYRAVQIAALNHVFGMAFEKIAGYNPAFDIISTIATLFGWDDDEDEEDTFGDNAKQAWKELLGDLPYTSLITDGGRIPAASALPIKQLVSGVDKYGNEKPWWETALEAAPYYLLPGGYSQIKKTTQGLGMFSEEHPVSGSYTDSGNLRFPVEKTFGNVLQAGVFGQYASENARDYFDNERSPLKEKQIQEYIDVDIPIKDYWEYREGLAKQKTNEDKVDYIDSLDLPLSKKNILVNNVLDRKESVDLEGYENFSGLEEFDFATKYPEKYQFFEEIGITFEEYSKADDDSKDAYNWAYQNPEKYTVAKAISGDVVEYRSYTKDIYKIEADKDENGKSINGSKKEKVFSYIDNLPLDYGQKCILFKSQYKADDSMNMDILEYLDSREDISYEEMVTILTELDFTVNGNNVYWD